ncbi:MAG TPA: hypothetical protein VG476_10930, partial [Acidimicrobiales bacterium]|nr:hypothetical protein [Acidimicrobiales bacterium]
MAQVAVNKASSGDRERLADAFADAFADDPIFLWLLAGKPHTDRRLQRFFRMLVGDELRHADHEVYLTEDGSGGAIWKGIDRWKTPVSTMVRQLPGLTRAFG